MAVFARTCWFLLFIDKSRRSVKLEWNVVLSEYFQFTFVSIQADLFLLLVKRQIHFCNYLWVIALVWIRVSSWRRAIVLSIEFFMDDEYSFRGCVKMVWDTKIEKIVFIVYLGLRAKDPYGQVGFPLTNHLLAWLLFWKNRSIISIVWDCCGFYWIW